MDMRDIGARIKRRREYLSTIGKGYSPDEVAARLGLIRMAYTHFEEGRREIGALDLVKLGELLHCKIAYFFGQDKGPASLIDLSNGHHTALKPDTCHQPATKADIEQLQQQLTALTQALQPAPPAKPEPSCSCHCGCCQEEVPLALQTIYAIQARVYEGLPPGKAREQYAESLRVQAEAALALLEHHLDTSES